jgi:glucosamine-6-phosphate deaminase
MHRIVRYDGSDVRSAALNPRKSPMTSVTDPLEQTHHRTVERLQVRSFATRAAMGRMAAHDIAGEIRARLSTGTGVRVIFAAAPSQTEMIDALIAEPDIDWRRVTAFHMDEYIGLAERAPQRFAMWLRQRLFDRLPFAAVHPILPEPDPNVAAADYAALLDAAPIQIVCLGIGVNGHLAFNDPPVADFTDPDDVKIVELDAVCRRQQVDDGCFPNLAAVPERALTLTIPRLLRADRLFCVVPGPMKRAAVHATLHGPISTACPASVLRRQANCTLYLDGESDPDA